MKQPAASPGRTEKPQQQQQLPAPPGLARLLLSKSRRGARSRRAPATSPMFVSRGRRRGAAAAAAGADGEPSSPKVTCIGQVRMRKGKKGGKKGPTAPLPPAKETKGRGYCRCLKKAFLCGGLFDFDRTRRRKGPAPEAERTRRSPWVFSSRDVAVAAAPKPSDPACDRAEEEDEKSVGASSSVERDEKADETGTDSGGKEEEEEEREGEAAELVSSATATPPKNALLLMRCRSAPQNRSSPLTSRFAPGAAPSPVQEMADFAVELIAATPPRASPSPRKPDMASPWASPSPRKPDMVSPWASPSPRKPGMPLSPRAAPSPRKPDMAQSPRASPSPRKLPDMASVESDDENEKRQETAASTQEQEEKPHEQEHEADEDEDDEAEEMRCSSARPLVLQRCKSEPATTAAAKMAAGAGAEGAPSGCFWANGGSSGRRRHAPQMSPAAAAPVALTGH